MAGRHQLVVAGGCIGTWRPVGIETGNERESINVRNGCIEHMKVPQGRTRTHPALLIRQAAHALTCLRKRYRWRRHSATESLPELLGAPWRTPRQASGSRTRSGS